MKNISIVYNYQRNFEPKHVNFVVSTAVVDNPGSLSAEISVSIVTIIISCRKLGSETFPGHLRLQGGVY